MLWLALSAERRPRLTGAARGEGVVHGFELCDDGNVFSSDGCPSDCGLCGNGQVDELETCDEGTLSAVVTRFPDSTRSSRPYVAVITR